MSMHRIADLSSNSHSKQSSCWSNSYVSTTKHCSKFHADTNRSTSSTSMSSTSSEDVSITDSDSASSISIDEENQSHTTLQEENRSHTSYSSIDSSSSLSTISASTSPTQYTNSVNYFPNNAFVANKVNHLLSYL